VGQRRSTRGDGARETVTLDIEGVKLKAEVWHGRSGWNASAFVDRRDLRVMGAADRDDALTRLRASILDNVEATHALGVRNRRYWSPNPYWRGH
jgi:hypothetical protein